MTSTSEQPLVSVIVPCFNEVDYIEDFVSNVYSQDYKNIQVIVADGNSDDGTLALLHALCDDYESLEIVDNQAKIVSSGLNLAIQRSLGSIIVRFDVHTAYDVSYISEVVKLLRTGDYDCIGGAWNIFVPDYGVARGIALSFRSYLGSGGALSRDSGYSGLVDTVYLGAWPKDVFDKYGYFDEALVRNQDDEFCLRIKLGGGRVYQSSKIKSKYFGRKTFTKLANQFYQYGFWKPHVILKHKAVASIRHLFPTTMVVLFSVLVVMSFYNSLFLEITSLLFAAYMGIIYGSLRLQHRRERLLICFTATFSIMTMHFSYGVGFVVGLYSRLINVKLATIENSKISR